MPFQLLLDEDLPAAFALREHAGGDVVLTFVLIPACLRLSQDIDPRSSPLRALALFGRKIAQHDERVFPPCRDNTRAAR